MIQEIKKIKFTIFVVLLLSVLVFACQKKPLERFVPDRMFTPTSITFTTSDTSVTVSWPASLFSAGSGVTYTLEISEDSAFQAAPALSLVVDSTRKTISDDSLKTRTSYFARVKANKTNTGAESGWVISDTHFTLVGVQIFQPVSLSDVIDNAVILSWTPTEGINKILFTAANGDTLSAELTAEENEAGSGIFDGLMPATSYTAQIFAGNKNKGLVTFTTKQKVTGNNVVDLRGINNNPEILFDTLSQIASGSVVLLKRGLTYTIPSAFVFEKSVSIQSGLGFGSPAMLMLSNNFDASGNIDSLHFTDITIANDGNASYFMNIGNETTIKDLSVKNVTTQGEFSNSFIRLKKGNAVIQNLEINNCIIDSFGVASKYAVLYANASSSAVIENINISNSTFSYIYYFVRQDKVTGISLNINNCTFNNMINNGGYFVNYSGSFPTQFTISNCIFGSIIDPSNANGIKTEGNASISNSYATSDDVFSANPILGLTAYPGNASALFNDPANGDFTIKDPSFAGKNTAGDPRWR